jgi:hypothetical protein
MWLMTIPAKAPLETGGIQTPFLVSPFGKEPAPGPFLDQGEIKRDFPFPWIPDQVRDGEKEKPQRAY